MTRLIDLKEGDTVAVDDGFTCMAQGHHRVRKDISGKLYVRCAEGSHFLDGQLDEHENLVGISLIHEHPT